METHTLQEFREKFKVEELTILKNKSWTWSVRPGQATLGSGVISLNRYALEMSDVTSEEFIKLGELIQHLEKVVKKVFNHSIMNYLMLMMVDHHVHYHVIPRYNEDRTFENLTWVDNGWPALPALGDNQYSDIDLLTKIQAALKENTNAHS
jgi:diadenosine tetraphosphate (Ap4A) HIT family hydrolase